MPCGIKSLAKLQVSEAFSKIREQCKAFAAAPDMHALGLSLVNTTSLAYFKPEHRAEMFTLKAMLYSAQARALGRILFACATSARGGEWGVLSILRAHCWRKILAPCIRVMRGLPSAPRLLRSMPAWSGACVPVTSHTHAHFAGGL